jgi:isopenicillin N synthase-like dioxygenase
VIVQIGDGLAEWSNHLLKPLVHRVIVEPNTPRTSVASFAVLENKTPFHNLVTDAVIEPTYFDYIKEHLKNTYKPRWRR